MTGHLGYEKHDPSGWISLLPVGDEDLVGAFGLLGGGGLSVASLLVGVGRASGVRWLPRRDGALAASSSFRRLWATSPGQAKS
jgi:hypothetical protein